MKAAVLGFGSKGRVAIAWLLTSVALGCGGAGSEGGAGSDGGQDLAFGSLTTRAVGGIQEPITMTSSQSSVVGVFGANFTSIAVNRDLNLPADDPRLLAGSSLLVGKNNRPNLYDYSSGQLTPLSLLPSQSPIGCYPSFSGAGDQFVSTEYNAATASFGLYRYSADGQNRTLITSGVTSSVSPAWSPAASRIAFARQGDIYGINSDGTNLANLTNTAHFEASPKWNGAGTKIYFVRQPSGTLDWEIWVMNPDGSGQTKVINLASSITDWDLSPNGLAFIYGVYNGSSTDLRGGELGTFDTTLGSADGYAGSFTFSPTGSRVALILDGAGQQFLQTMHITGGTPSTLLSLEPGFYWRGLDWSPMPGRRIYVAASGASLATNAAGFLYATQDGVFRSLLVFDAVTRETVDIDPAAPPGNNVDSHIATITAADSINLLRYANGYVTPRANVVGSGGTIASCSGAIVSINADDGRIVSVTPFNRTRNAPKPEPRVEATRITYSGDFLAVFDGDGKLTHGASSQIVLDRKTGRVVSVH